MNGAWTHTTVLQCEAVDALLKLQKEGVVGNVPGVYVDATYGRGGHSRLILSKLSASGRLIAFDKDPEACSDGMCITDDRFSIRHMSFCHLDDLQPSSVAGVLFDLGVSSPQVDNPARGFSFQSDGELDMRMNPTRGQSVAQWLAVAEVTKIAEVIRDYGEERFAGSIAKAIVKRREMQGPITTTTELARLVADTVKTRESGKNPATRTFQAFRIFINAELEDLQHALTAALKVLQPGGRLVVISFHSLEDRMVKLFMARHSREVFDRRAPFAAPQVMALKVLGRVRPSVAEVASNSRARSAIMRIAERIAPGVFSC